MVSDQQIVFSKYRGSYEKKKKDSFSSATLASTLELQPFQEIFFSLEDVGFLF